MTIPSKPEKKVSVEAIHYDNPQRQPRFTLLDEKQWHYIQRHYRMSPRELQVAKLVCQGFTNGDVASILKVKQGTVKTHIRSIFGKVRARNKISLLLRLVHAASIFNSNSLGGISVQRAEADNSINR
jgi:DNA-binding NarL/FixJ family response regulator